MTIIVNYDVGIGTCNNYCILGTDKVEYWKYYIEHLK